MASRAIAPAVVASVPTSVKRPVKRELLRANRLWRRVTALWRVLPDFLIVGAQRAGSTSLYAHLTAHPQVLPAARKEVHYFDLNFHRGRRWYRGHFPLAEIRRRHARRHGVSRTGEASPYYLYHPLAPRRAGELLPEARIIAVLRNPVDRAYSHYHHQVAKGRESLAFAEAVREEGARLAGEEDRLRADATYVSVAHRRYSYLGRGLYARQLEAWLGVYPAERVLVVCTEELGTDPARVMASVLAFLGLDEARLASAVRHHRTVYGEMDQGLRRELTDYFRPHNERLFALLGRRLSWDD